MEQSEKLACELNSQSRISVTPNSANASATRHLRLGILFCIAATTFYSFSNVCFKELKTLDIDIRWTLCLKEMICVCCVTPVIVVQCFRRRYTWPAWSWIVFILIGGFVCQFIGARLHIWAIGTVGLVVSIPLMQAANLTGSVGIGRVFLGERVAPRCRLAICVMLMAICCLFFGPKPHDAETIAQPIVSNTLLIGAIGAVTAGLAYSIYIVFLRRASNSRQMPVSFIAVEITGIGAVIFGFEFLHDHGYQISAFWANMPFRAWLLVGISGLFNMIGFLFQINGLRYIMVARAQMISVLQIVIGTLFGVFFYHEMTNVMVWLGLTLTVLGIYIVSTPDKKELSADKNVESDGGQDLTVNS